MNMRGEFLEHAAGTSFCVHFEPVGDPRRRVLVVPAFGEEMNKSRALLACTARALCRLGVASTVFDLAGTGDSHGELDTVGWNAWRNELRELFGQLSAGRDTPMILLTVRSGSLLLDADLVRAADVLCWQPVTDGRRFLQQFLRLRAMADKFAGRDGSLKTLEARLAAGETIEVAGYPLTPALTEGLAAARLDPVMLAAARRVDLLEFRTTPGEVSPALARLAGAVTVAGGAAGAHLVKAEPFWATQEIALPQTVVDATVELIGSCL